MVPAKPRRRWFRFSLRSLLILITLVAIATGWIARERMQSAHEHRVAERLQQQGWYVEFAGPLGDDPADKTSQGST